MGQVYLATRNDRANLTSNVNEILKVALMGFFMPYLCSDKIMYIECVIGLITFHVDCSLILVGLMAAEVII